MEKNKSKKLLLEFFSNAKIEDEGGVLTISDVDKEFEKFIGKKSPYKLVFDIELNNKIKDSELISQGSYFFLAIRDYLKDKGLTTIRKIEIKPEIINNKKINKKKTEKMEISRLGYLAEFSYLSIYQYLNEKKQSIKKVLLRDKKVINLEMNNFKTQNGNKEEIELTDIEEQYKQSKRYLEESLKKEEKTIRGKMIGKLDKELERIKVHYHKQIKEKDEEVERCANKITTLNNKLKHTFYDRDRRILQMLIKESIERLEQLKKKTYKERLVAEEKFHINDTVEKHALSIKRNLINISIYYYPIYKVTLLEKRKTKIVEYDPIFDEINKLPNLNTRKG